MDKIISCQVFFSRSAGKNSDSLGKALDCHERRFKSWLEDNDGNP
jgi:hypothetical protein